MEYIVEAIVEGKSLTIKSGKVAKQAAGSAIVQYGDTIVLVTVAYIKDAKEGTDFLPLSVEYIEKIYAAGRIPGNYFRREVGRPSEKEVLTCRLIDRPIRPLFPDAYCCETQVIATVLSMDKENDSDILALIGASAALSISEIPFMGPIAGVRVARIDGKFVANPTISQSTDPACDINIIVAGSKTGITMVEGGGQMVTEAEMLEAIYFGHDAIQPIIIAQEKLQAALGKEKRIFEAKPQDEALLTKIKEIAAAPLRVALMAPDKFGRKDAVSKVKADLIAALGEEYADRKAEVSGMYSEIVKKVSRDIILTDQIRVDGRKFDEVRPITCDIDILPRPHGSALFTRGETQVLGILTLGSGRDAQKVELLHGESEKSFMLHYNFPPYCVGEVKRVGAPSRREYGHGALATRAIEAILPEKEDFDYTIRLVSEVTESNGSSSMGTVCSCTLALMDGGVPIKAPVSGIAMGLVKEGEKIAILSDILGDEDHTGDMDFKVCGTSEGITALQMDIKINELPKEIMAQALEQARKGRLHILGKMLESISESRDEISPHAPKIHTMQINTDKIREIIGAGGKVIRQIQADTNTQIEINDSGIIKISASNEDDALKAKKIISDIALDPEIGGIYEGLVAKITDFGAFVTIKPGCDGLVHISELAKERVRKVTDVISEGETIRVKVLEISRDGKIRLSRKALLEDTND